MKLSIKEFVKWDIKLLLSGFVAVLLNCLIFSFNVMAYDEITIVIDPGHGGNAEVDEADLGATYGDITEKDINLLTAKALAEELSEYGNARVLLTREDDVHMTLEERVNYAASVGADMLISVHYNASENHRFFGSEIFVSAFGNNYARGKSLANHIMDAWDLDGEEIKGIKTRIGKNGDDYYGLIRMGAARNIPTIILEHAYIDNKRDKERVGNEECYKKFGILDATAIAEYYGFEKDVVKQNIVPDDTVNVEEEAVRPDDTSPTEVSVTIDSYNATTGEIRYTVSATEDESMLMYYAMDTEAGCSDESTSFSELSLWEKGAGSMNGTFTVPKDFRSNVIVRVYNNYELYTDSDKIMISPDMPAAKVEINADGEISKESVLSDGEKEISIDIDKVDEHKTVISKDFEEGSFASNIAAKDEEAKSRDEEVKALEEKAAEIQKLKDEYAIRENKQRTLIYILFGTIGLIIVIMIAFIVTSIRKKRRSDDDGYDDK